MSIYLSKDYLPFSEDLNNLKPKIMFYLIDDEAKYKVGDIVPDELKDDNIFVITTLQNRSDENDNKYHILTPLKIDSTRYCWCSLETN